MHPQGFGQMVFVLGLCRIELFDPFLQEWDHCFAPSLLQFASSELARRVFVGLEQI